MKRRMKKCVSAFLALMLLTTLLPAAGFAEDGQRASVSTSAQSPVQLTKSVQTDNEGDSTLSLEAYVTGNVTHSDTPLDIVMVMDQSGSMQGDNLTALKAAANTFMKTIAKDAGDYNVDHRVAVVGYASDEDAGTTGYDGDIINGSHSYWVNTGLYVNGDFKNYVTEDSYQKINRNEMDTSLVYYIKDGSSYKEIRYRDGKWKYQGFFGWWYEIDKNETVYKLVSGTKLSAADYQASLVSAGNSGTVNSVVSQTINKLAASGATYTEYGMLMAGEVFKNNPIPSDQTRKRVVVLFTDGSTNSDRNTVLGHSNMLKKTYGADVFTVGLGVEDESDFLRYISSDYKYDTSYKNKKYYGTPSADGIDYSLNAKTAEGLKEAFEKIAQDVASVPADATTVLSDTMSDMFVPTTDANGVKVYTQTASGTGSKPSWGDPVDITKDVTVKLEGKTFKVSGFNYNENLVLQKNGTWQGKKLVVKFGIKPDTTYTNWQKGTHYYDTNNITDKQAALRDKDGKVLGESLDKSPQLPVTGHSITYSWTNAPTSENVPNVPNVPVDNNVYVKGQSYTVDSEYTQNTQVPTQDDYDNLNGIYTFNGWNDPNNGVMGDSDITITGSWTYKKIDPEKFTLKYDANGGEGTMTDSNSPYVKNSKATVLDNGFTRSNYCFTGWNTKADGTGKSYNVGDVITMNENVTLYAQWKTHGLNVSKQLATVNGTPITDNTIFKAGDTLTWNIQVKNIGEVAIQNISVKDVLKRNGTEITGVKLYFLNSDNSVGAEVPTDYTFALENDQSQGFAARYTIVKEDEGKTLKNTAIAYIDGEEKDKGESSGVDIAVPHKITYNWGTKNIPAGVTLPTGNPEVYPGQSYTVDTTYTNKTKIEFKDGNENVTDVYTFSGWTDKNPTPGVMGNSDLTITGSWTYEKIDPETFTLNYDANGGEGAMTDKASPYVNNSEAKVLDNEFTRSNYRFTGWNTKADGTGDSYQAGDVIKMIGNMTLYAQWKHKGGGGSGDKKVTLHYESNGGTTYKDERYTYGTTVKLDKTPLREGHTFTGWYADKELTKKISNITMKGDKTVYAGWELTPVPPAFDGDHTAYIIGFVDGTVKPLANITRSEVAAIFYRLLSDEEREKYKTTTNNFADVDQSAWYNTPASTMAAMGIIGGYPDGLFHGTDNITRAEFAAICARFDKNTENTKADFSDISGHWAELDIAIAANNGWIMGYPDGTFRPNQTITRAEAMALINRVLARIPESPQDLLDDMKTWPDNMNTDKWYYIPVQEATNSHDFERKANGSEKWTALNKDAGVMP